MPVAGARGQSFAFIRVHLRPQTPVGNYSAPPVPLVLKSDFVNRSRNFRAFLIRICFRNLSALRDFAVKTKRVIYRKAANSAKRGSFRSEPRRSSYVVPVVSSWWIKKVPVAGAGGQSFAFIPVHLRPQTPNGKYSAPPVPLVLKPAIANCSHNFRAFVLS